MSFSDVSGLRTPNSLLRTLRGSSLDDLFQLVLTHPKKGLKAPRKALFRGEGAGGLASFAAGWMAVRGMDVVVLDGANRFDPYRVSFFARSASIPPERLLRTIRIARAFTCHQMATLIGEKLPLLLEKPLRRPSVILLGPVTTFLDEDVPDQEAGTLFERGMGKAEAMASKGIPFLLFQPFIPSSSKRGYLVRRLLQFAELVWRVDLNGEVPNLILEKSLTETMEGVDSGPVKTGIQNLEFGNWGL